jgi:IS605 OrfB family transposase
MQFTRSLKLKFLDLNQAKADLFDQTTVEYTSLANELLKIPISERKKLTTAKVVSPLKSALVNQVIRQVKGEAGEKSKGYKLLPPEVNNQNWKLHRVGDTYSVSFPTLQGVKRVPLNVEGKHWLPIFDKVLGNDPTLKLGTLKLLKRKHKWYALIAITQEVPDAKSTNRVGVDRGQNNLAVAANKPGKCLFFSGKQVRHKRRHFQRLRHQLQKAGKYRAVKKLVRSETRWMSEINHALSKQIAQFADSLDADLVLEDLSGCRQTMKQSKKVRSDAGNSRHTWAYYDLELKLAYKMAMLGREVHIRPAAYTSKSSSYDGRLGYRDGHWFYAPSGQQVNADWNAALNLAQWDGFSCPLELYVPRDGAFDNPQNTLLVQPGTAEPNSMNTARGRGEYVQLSLFDTTSDWARRENPTCF